MFTWIQKYQHGLLVAVLVVTVLAMVWLFNPASDMQAFQQNRVAKVYGQNVGVEEFRKYLRLVNLAAELGLEEYLRTIVSQADAAQMDAEDVFAFNTMILRREAEKLQLEPSNEEVVAALAEIPAFQDDQGRYDVNKANLYLTESLPSRGLSRAQFEELIKDTLRLKMLSEMISGAVPQPEADARIGYDLANQRTLLQMVEFNTTDFSKDIQPTEEEIAEHYEMNLGQYMTPETRRIEYVTFKLPEEAKPEGEAATPEGEAAPAPEQAEKEQTPEERKEQLAKLSELAGKSMSFVVAVSEAEAPNAFAEKAKEMGLEVKTTKPYEQGGYPTELFSLGYAVFQAAPQLTKEVPISDPIQNEEEFTVLHLAELQESRQMTLEEAKADVIQDIKDAKGKTAMMVRAEEVRGLLIQGLEAGKTLEDLVKELDLKLLTPAPLVLREPPRDMPHLMSIQEEIPTLPTGKISAPLEIPGGSVLVYVKQREAANEDVWMTEKDSAIAGYRQGMQGYFLQSWFKNARKAANLEVYAAAGATQG